MIALISPHQAVEIIHSSVVHRSLDTQKAPGTDRQLDYLLDSGGIRHILLPVVMLPRHVSLGQLKHSIHELLDL